MRRIAMFVLIVTGALAGNANAQRLWLSPDAGRNVGIDITKGFYQSGSELDFASVTMAIRGRFPMKDKLALTLELPYARLGVSSQFGGGTASSLGNPWVGLEYTSKPNLSIEAGLRPGVASDQGDDEAALLFGVIQDFDRFEAWLPKVTSLRVMAHIGRTPEHGTFVSGILGGTVTKPENGETDLFANYGLRAGYRDTGLLATLALTGRANVTGDGSLEERTVHQVTFMVEKTRGGFRPYGSIKTYLDDEPRQSIKAIIGFGASFGF